MKGVIIGEAGSWLLVDNKTQPHIMRIRAKDTHRTPCDERVREGHVLLTIERREKTIESKIAQVFLGWTATEGRVTLV